VHHLPNPFVTSCVFNLNVRGRVQLKRDGTHLRTGGEMKGKQETVASKRHMTAEHRLARAVQTLQADVYSSPASRLN